MPPGKRSPKSFGESLNSFDKVMKARPLPSKNTYEDKILIHTCILRGFTNPSKVNIMSEKTSHFEIYFGSTPIPLSYFHVSQTYFKKSLVYPLACMSISRHSQRSDLCCLGARNRGFFSMFFGQQNS